MSFGTNDNCSLIMKIKDVPILDLIPQRPPIVMVDKVVHFDEIVTVTHFTVRGDCIFVENGELTPNGMVENIAQTCAARIGYINFLANEQIRLGFIGAVRNMIFRRSPRVGETLVTTIRVREEVFRMTLVDAEICVGDEVLATAEMKIALSETNAQ